MHSDELLRLFDEWACYEGKDPIVMIIKELITRSDLHTAAIVELASSRSDSFRSVTTPAAHTAPKPTYTAADIKAIQRTPGWCVECDIYGWSGDSWLGLGAAFAYRSQHDAEAIVAHLRATHNLPKG